MDANVAVAASSNADAGALIDVLCTFLTVQVWYSVNFHNIVAILVAYKAIRPTLVVLLCK